MLKIGTIYRTTRTPDFTSEYIDDHHNYYYETNYNGRLSFAPRQGITPFAPVVGRDGISRTPVYIIQVSHTSSGTNYNPWHDEINTDNGYIKYYGDNKPDTPDPKNPLLVEQYYVNTNPDKNIRKTKSVPIICLEKTSSGYNRFQVFGII